MKELGELNYLLGIEFSRSEQDILMHQRKYALELIFDLGLSGAKPSKTPIDTSQNLIPREYDEYIGGEQLKKDKVLLDQGQYQRLIGKLLYLTVIRHDIAYGV